MAWEHLSTRDEVVMAASLLSFGISIAKTREKGKRKREKPDKSNILLKTIQKREKKKENLPAFGREEGQFLVLLDGVCSM